MKKILTTIIFSMIIILSLVACSTSKPTNIIDLNNSIYDKNGYFKNIIASDYVKVNNLDKVEVDWKNDVEAVIQDQLKYYAEQNIVKDRAVVDGDIVNIDFIGYVDGKEYDELSTNGKGTYVEIGVSEYIDNFLEQLIGHKPCDTFEINVTFPTDYKDNSEYAGKESTVVVTINHILEFDLDEWNDEFVKKHYETTLGITTTKEAEQVMINDAVFNALCEAAEFNENLPESLIDWQHTTTIDYYHGIAENNKITYEEYLKMLGVDSEDQLRETNLEAYKTQIKVYLICQAIAEQTNYIVSDEDIDAYLIEINRGSDGIITRDVLNKTYGINYIKAIIMYDHIQKHISDDIDVSIINK